MDDFNTRIDRLTERHEALTQSVESLTLDIRELRETVSEMAKANEKRFADFEQGANLLLAGMKGLVTIAESHENRINGLEGK